MWLPNPGGLQGLGRFSVATAKYSFLNSCTGEAETVVRSSNQLRELPMFVRSEPQKFKAATGTGTVANDGYSIHLLLRKAKLHLDYVANIQTVLDQRAQPTLAYIEADAASASHAAGHQHSQAHRNAVDRACKAARR
jgi:hypothetical protein